ncbi:hypothetical protein B5X24_HaOG210154 [Helicoverpa armigera]|uniref:Uncharacterized protein n=1 Tax=Helicoverpa armigera TaxID=29058 RepID=A0A2W1BJN9_HELAM|nr:hypothetical protein B5X24_HaOG210154 [Helicoverpa armigera]
MTEPEHHQANFHDPFNDRHKIVDRKPNSTNIITAEHHKQKANNIPRIIEDHNITDQEKDERKHDIFEHRRKNDEIPLESQRSYFISQNNPYLDNQVYERLFPVFRSPNRLNRVQFLRQSTISSYSIVTYVLYSEVSAPTKGSESLNLPSSMSTTDNPASRKIFSPRNRFEEIFGNEMTNYLAMDKPLLTRSGDERLPTERVPMNAYKFLSELQTKPTEYITEPTKPIGRMRYVPTWATNATRPVVYKTTTKPLEFLPHIILFTSNTEETTNTELTTRPQDIVVTFPSVITTTASSTLPKTFVAPISPSVDPYISTATATQEQSFSIAQSGFPHVGTTPAPAFDSNTMTTIKDGRPINVPVPYTTILTTAGQGKFFVTRPPPPPRILAYHKLMQSLSEGYMVVFLLELCRLITVKANYHVQSVIMNTATIVNELRETRRLAWFGQPLLDVTMKLSIFMTEAEIDVKKSYAAMLHHMLLRRRRELSAEVNSIIEYAGMMYRYEEGNHLFNVLKEFEEYPNVTLRPYFLCDSLIEAFLRPFRRMRYSPQRRVLLDSINKALKNRFPNDFFKKPEKVDKLMERNQQTSQVSFSLTAATFLPNHYRLRKRRRRRRKKRKHYHYSSHSHLHRHRHRHRHRKHRHTTPTPNEDIFS